MPAWTDPQSTLRISASAIRSNVQKICSHVDQQYRPMAVIKADGYGVGAASLARVLHQAGVDAFAVANVQEAISLRENGLNGLLLVFHLGPREFSSALALNCDLCLHTPSQIEASEQAAQQGNQVARVHLHVDTGMGRLACSLEEAPFLARRIASSPYLELAGFMTHFASAEDPEADTLTGYQETSFSSFVREMANEGLRPRWIHASNSAASTRFPHFPYNLARLGLGLFGISASQAVKRSLALEPALSLEAPVIAVRSLPKNYPVGYGSHYRTPATGTKIATLALGYHDGLPRAYHRLGAVFLHHLQVPVAGMISMDYTTIDVSGLGTVDLGDMAQIFGPHQSIEQVAEWAGVIPHELLARLGPRVKRTLC